MSESFLVPRQAPLFAGWPWRLRFGASPHPDRRRLENGPTRGGADCRSAEFSFVHRARPFRPPRILRCRRSPSLSASHLPQHSSLGNRRCSGRRVQSRRPGVWPQFLAAPGGSMALRFRQASLSSLPLSTSVMSTPPKALFLFLAECLNWARLSRVITETTRFSRMLVRRRRSAVASIANGMIRSLAGIEALLLKR